MKFILIYIREAHSVNGWRFPGENYSFVRDHLDLHNRIDAIETLISRTEEDSSSLISIYADTMTDRTNHLFRAWPERLYVFRRNEIIYRGSKGPTGYSVPSLKAFLQEHL